MNLKAKRVYEILRSKFSNAKCELQFVNIYQLFISVILSAQCTDKRVNLITKELFKKYPTITEMAAADLLELENEIKSCGLYRNKAKNIISACKDIIERYDGNIPNEFNELITLSGVGRKTANVVMSAGFGADAIAVDTHVFRVSRRLELADANTPDKVEFQLQKVFDKKLWSEVHYLMVLFGRYICKAQKPLCENCELKDICTYHKNKK